jgi:hypothetical protein
MFDPSWYVAAHSLEILPDAALAHYLTEGQALGLSPSALFDEAWYRASYEEVAAAIAGGRFRSGFEHYCLEGHADRSPHWLFDHVLYRDANPALTDAALQEGGWFNLYDHMLCAGSALGRTSHALFDPARHAETFTDDPALTALGPFQHWLARLGIEAAPSLLFDPAWYRGFYPEPDAAIATGAFSSALHHYLTNPTPQAFDPLPDFSEAFYLKANPDIAALVETGVFRNGYAHYLQHGAAADLIPSPWLDPADYRARTPQVADAIESGDVPHAFAHALGEGASRGLAGASGVADLNPSLFTSARVRCGIAFNASATPPVSVIAVIPPRAERGLETLAMLQGSLPQGSELFGLVHVADRATAYGMLPGAKMITCDDDIPAARSTALREASGDLVLLVDAGAILPPDSVAAALRRMEDSAIGVVGGPLLDVQGRLLGAGGVVSNDGSRSGYLRGGLLSDDEAAFARDVDYCSSGLLLVRRSVAIAVGGFATGLDQDLADADFCLRVWQSGYRVTYDPRVMLVYPDPRGLRAAASRIDLAPPGAPACPADAAETLRRRHPAYVERRLPMLSEIRHAARTPRQSTDSVLVLAASFHAADTARADLVPRLAKSGADVTVFPLDGGPTNPAFLPRNLPDSVEVVTGVGEGQLAGFLASRRGCFSRVEYMSDALAARFRGWIEI